MAKQKRNTNEKPPKKSCKANDSKKHCLYLHSCSKTLQCSNNKNLNSSKCVHLKKCNHCKQFKEWCNSNNITFSFTTKVYNLYLKGVKTNIHTPYSQRSEESKETTIKIFDKSICHITGDNNTSNKNSKQLLKDYLKCEIGLEKIEAGVKLQMFDKLTKKLHELPYNSPIRQDIIFVVSDRIDVATTSNILNFSLSTIKRSKKKELLTLDKIKYGINTSKSKISLEIKEMITKFWDSKCKPSPYLTVRNQNMKRSKDKDESTFTLVQIQNCTSLEMYKQFVEFCSLKSIDNIPCIGTFLKYKPFNIKLATPRSGECPKCLNYKNKSNHTEEEVKEYEEHKLTNTKMLHIMISEIIYQKMRLWS